MQVGLLTLGDLLTDPVSGARRTHAERHRNIVQQGVLADELGFTSVHLGEHHFCDYIMSSPPVVLAAIAEHTSRIRLSTGVALGANLSPLRIAEDYATVDVLSGGRVEPVVGRGTFFPHTYAAFGQDPMLARELFAEHVEILVRVWESEAVTWEGAHHPPLDSLTVNPRPIQQPRPPIWLGAGASPESIDLAARLGLGLMLPTVFGTIEMFQRSVDAYEAAWDRYGRNPADRRIGCCSHCFVHRDHATARRIWEPRYRAYIEFVNALTQQSSHGRISGMGDFDFDTVTSNTALCGSPQHVVDRMGEIAELLHLDTHILMFDMGGLPDMELFTTIALAGTEVLPGASRSGRSIGQRLNVYPAK